MNTSADTSTVSVTQTVGTVNGGKVTGIEVASQIADTITNQTVVDRRVITNNIITLNDPQLLDAVVAKLTAALGVDKTVLQSPPTVTIQAHIGQQIDEVAAAQKDVAAHGLVVSAQALYDLGMLMAYRRDLDAALDYFRQAAQAQPDFADAHEAIAWIQRSRVGEDMMRGDYATAQGRLSEAREAIVRADPNDPQMLALHGFIAQLSAQVARLLHQPSDAQRFALEAASAFQRAAAQSPDDPSVLSGLASCYVESGDFDAAIAAYQRAIKLLPSYIRAHKDLALAYECKLRADGARASQWCEKAIQSWKKFCRLAPNDPTLTDEYMMQINRHVSSLETECARLKPHKKTQRVDSSPSTPRKKLSTNRLKSSARSK